MKELVLAKEELFQGVHCDVWMNADREPFMTMDQIAEVLEYTDRKGIEKIIERNSYLKDKEFSTTYDLSEVEGNRLVKRERRMFTRDGVMEISFLSRKPKAREFRAWARRVLNTFMNGQLVWKEQRQTGKTVRHSMTDAIKEKELSPHYYKHYTELAYKSALGFTAKQLRAARGINTAASPLDYLTAEELAAVNEREQQIAMLIRLDLDYQAIKELVSRQGIIYQTTLKMPTAATTGA